MTEKKEEKPFVNTVNDASKMKVCCKGQPDRTEDLGKKIKEETKPVGAKNLSPVQEAKPKEKARKEVSDDVNKT